ncbi:hypothetical protein SAMN04488030_1359 [Aliiroseovarius halocynthiae]|uniref:DUF1365 domain-containing protein n=1 Tax=Aliiroseovarius halocynthiae TaxID=985055 RepID=A0A545SWA9_9RHOB|nr:DUF1365 domain-containing protein [Aliiroseovarius halocynthiae]TQV69245.1 DUF1365 domain-containing protein [Aliiroseovarius halocynthiae]SMR72014.1 hypothetical protein SAMN04488030_1359 [Aliiroseovarius halocynthiae]
MLDHIQATTLHARLGNLKNAFRYGVDFVLTDLSGPHPAVLSMDRFNLWSLRSRHHGGARGDGHGVVWFRDQLAARQFPVERATLYLLTQPSFLWFHFNPVSFWIAVIDDQPCAFIAEVNSTFGQRHCYFCAHSDFRPIQPADKLEAKKLMHVSPFQKIEGRYLFNFELSNTRVNIRISYENKGQGVLATLQGPRKPATNGSLLWAATRRPFGAARVVALIHWQAAILYLKRAPFLKKQPAPEPLVSDGHTVDASGK